MIWVIGSKGMLGQELTKYCEVQGIDFCGTDMEVNILSEEALRTHALSCKPSWIVNCSAYTAVDQAEDDKEKAFLINESGVRNIASVAASLDIPLIHISTDYVFNGNSDTPLSETADTDPIGVYGASKLAGEEQIRSLSPRHFIIRTAWLYGEYGNNFVHTMLKLMESRDEISVVKDQIGSPTWTKDLVSLIGTIIEKTSESYGLYHFSGDEQCSWWEFAVMIYNQGKYKGLLNSSCAVKPCSSELYPTKAKRPSYSLLNKSKVKNNFAFKVSSWEDSLERFLEEKTNAV